MNEIKPIGSLEVETYSRLAKTPMMSVLFDPCTLPYPPLLENLKAIRESVFLRDPSYRYGLRHHRSARTEFIGSSHRDHWKVPSSSVLIHRQLELGVRSVLDALPDSTEIIGLGLVTLPRFTGAMANGSEIIGEFVSMTA